MKNILGNILPIASFVLILTAIAGLINKLFDANIAIYDTEIPSDSVIIAVLFIIGVICLLPILFVMFRNRGAVQ